MFEPCCALLPFSLHVLVERQSHTLTVSSENRASRVPFDQGQAYRVEQIPLCDPVLPVLRHVWLGVSSGYVEDHYALLLFHSTQAVGGKAVVVERLQLRGPM
jgi:hypothetical protein